MVIKDSGTQFPWRVAFGCLDFVLFQNFFCLILSVPCSDFVGNRERGMMNSLTFWLSLLAKDSKFIMRV